MAEIKSTLDLIMERTAGLSLSAEEKAEQQAAEARKRAKGLALKVLSGRITDRQLERELAELQAEERDRFGRFVAWEFIRELNLDSYQPRLIGEALSKVLPELAGEVLEGLTEAAKKYRAETARRTALGYETALKELAGLGISGSAVRPKVNPDLDQDRYKAVLAELLGIEEG